MTKYKLILAAITAGLLLATNSRAQTETTSVVTVNLPATELENFELQTNTIIVKGFSLMGTVTLENNTLSVHTREANDVDHNQKTYGISVEFSGATSAGLPARVSLIIDYDELDSLANAIDYMSKVTWGVTSLNGFEASYVTKSGFRVLARSDRRQDAVNLFIQFSNLPRIPMSADQLSQFRSLITQAKSSIDASK